MKLCQVIAVETKIKAQAHEGITKVYHKLQKSDLLTGFSKNYRPKNENGETFPSESKKVQVNAEDALAEVKSALSELFDLTATKDYANCKATANVVLGENILLSDVPVSHLLFLEKKLTDLHTLVSKLPTLDSGENWRWDANLSCYASDMRNKHRTKKTPVVIVKAPATEQHPAQTELLYEDQLVGYWDEVVYSGALPSDRVKVLVNRIEALQKAVKYAREEANSASVEQVKEADKLFSYIFAP